MEILWQIIAIAAVIMGTFFSVVGVVGYIRLPDVYTRLHTTGKISVFVIVLLLVAVYFWVPQGWARALVFIFFLLAAGPPTAHAMGSAAYRIGLPRIKAVRDDLADHKQAAVDSHE
jgi:multicomponent Na+:H+ antiporter subunit G